MSVTMRIPYLLRELTEGKDIVSLDATTAGQALGELDAQYPGIRARICREDGSLQGFVNLYVNDDDVRFLDGLDTPLKDGYVLTILPMIAGG